jgi:hypothetical protein
LDLTDLFVFKTPADRGTTVLILDVNPFVTGLAFHPDAVYRINVDTDGDVHADVASTFAFLPVRERHTDGDRLLRHRP